MMVAVGIVTIEIVTADNSKEGDRSPELPPLEIIALQLNLFEAQFMIRAKGEN